MLFMTSKFLIIMLIFGGILFIVINLTKNVQECPTQQIVYKYVPRTFDEEQEEPVYASDIFKTMFDQPSPWMSSITAADNRKTKKVNDFFASQY